MARTQRNRTEREPGRSGATKGHKRPPEYHQRVDTTRTEAAGDLSESFQARFQPARARLDATIHGERLNGDSWPKAEWRVRAKGG